MYPFIKRLLDILSSLIVLILLSPFLFIVAILIMIDSRGGVFYKQERIGKNQKPFFLYKFRSMRPESDKGSKITIGSDPRITKIGAFIRQFKIDELPQLINIVKGEMSVVGPRPEVKQYVQLYTEKQLRVLTVKPGLTDFASIQFFNEQEILGKAEDPQKKYIEEVMPQKLELNLHYIEQASFKTDLTVIFRTLLKIIS